MVHSKKHIWGLILKIDQDHLEADLVLLEQAIGHGFTAGPVTKFLAQLDAEQEG